MTTRFDRERLAAKGFTLVEVMIATLVFSVGMMAVITMEFSAIRAYSASRDLSVATGVANRTVAMMRLEGANWSQQSLEALADTTNALPVFDPAQQSPVDINMLGSVVTNPWTWTRASDTPLTERMVKNAELGRYCIYVRGGVSEAALGGGDFDPNGTGMDTRVTPLIQTQIAVIYPTKSTGYASNDCTQVRCNGGTLLITDLLEPTGVDPTLPGVNGIPQLEQCGWRAVYAGALIQR